MLLFFKSSWNGHGPPAPIRGQWVGNKGILHPSRILLASLAVPQFGSGMLNWQWAPAALHPVQEQVASVWTKSSDCFAHLCHVATTYFRLKILVGICAQFFHFHYSPFGRTQRWSSHQHIKLIKQLAILSVKR